MQGADPLGAQPHLPGGLLTGDHEGRPVGGRDPVGDLEQQGGLADAGLPGHQQDRTGHQAAAEDAVELLDPGGDGSRAGELHFGDRPGGGRDRPGGHRAQGSSDGSGLLQGAPGLALGAPAHPLRRGVAALGAAVGGAGGLHTGWGHSPTLTAGTDSSGDAGG